MPRFNVFPIHFAKSLRGTKFRVPPLRRPGHLTRDELYGNFLPPLQERLPEPYEKIEKKLIDTADLPTESTVPRFYLNRNPLNLTLLEKEPKRLGFVRDKNIRPREYYSPVDYYYRLHLSMGQRCLTAWVQHTYGKIVISASTRERCIAHFLYSLTTVNAARNLGRIIAQRCKHMGISNVAWTRNYHYRRSPTRKYHRVDAFERGLRGAGIQLFEKKLRMRPPTKPYRVVSHYRGPPIKRAIDWNILR